jgi:hypothetical protein
MPWVVWKPHERIGMFRSGLCCHVNPENPHMESMELDQYLVFLLEGVNLTGQLLTKAMANAELLRG